MAIELSSLYSAPQRMPRVSIRRLFVYFLGAASFVLLALNFHQMLVGGSNYTWTGGGQTASGPSGPSGGPSGGPGTCFSSQY